MTDIVPDTSTAAAETPMRDHVERFWRLLETEHVRILVDIRRQHGEGQPVYWDGASFPDDVAKAIVAAARGPVPVAALIPDDEHALLDAVVRAHNMLVESEPYGHIAALLVSTIQEHNARLRANRASTTALCQWCGASVIERTPSSPVNDTVPSEIDVLTADPHQLEDMLFRLRNANAGYAITVWRNGGWKFWKTLDAKYAESDPDWLSTIQFTTEDYPQRLAVARALAKNANRDFDSLPTSAPPLSGSEFCKDHYLQMADCALAVAPPVSVTSG